MARAARPAPAPAGNREIAEGTGTVHRTIRLIAAVASASSDTGVGELAARLSLPIPTVHRLLHLLRSDGIVDWDANTHRYRIGPELYRIAAQVGTSTTMQDMARAEIGRLCDETGETILFGLYQPGTVSMSFEGHAEGSHVLQYRIRMHVPLSLVWGASGKAILAHLPHDVIAEALRRETDISQNGLAPPSLAQLEEELARYRKIGFGVSDGEKLAGSRGIAAAVFGLNGIVGSICMTSPKERIPVNRIAEFGELVLATARRLSRSLGAPLRDLAGPED